MILRIISGKFKGKKLKCLEGLKTRPTLDRVKESLFNVIQFQIEGKTVLDLFAGSGQLGIEAVSRGAAAADFIEADKKAFLILKENLDGLENCRAINSDYKVFLKNLQKAQKYDIIFIDPPFGEDLYNDAVFLSLNVINKNGVIICESGKEHKFENFVDLIYAEKIYGNIKLTFIKNQNED